ncbi:hypothetical protein [Streptomyces capitiformicae]|uniref:Uncharacterized protein n=1 Tax=Streptomyces capitiformicae TaxID=2014920 RepID=A0A919LA99_9ACTN|nr:hypothetical protein [Streptomyces capitiformicae]GHH88659.1 hypothetical protein GCM10017771_34950 [Streptomyces capitiformicae]
MRTLATATRAGVLGVAAGALLFTGVAAQGTAVAAPQGKPAKLTVAKYRDWLKNNDEAAASIKLLKAFDKLPKAKQQKFVTYLQDRKVQKAFDVRNGGYVTRGGTSQTIHNKDVRFVANVKAVNKTDKAGRHITLTFTATERIYDLPVITKKTVLSYTVKGGVKSPKLKSSVTNLNGAFAITPAKKDSLKTNGGNIWATTTWKATPLYKSAGAGSLVKEQRTVVVNVKYTANLVNK